MRPWIHRALRSRRFGPLLVLGTGVVALGGCGGALLANYTVAGMDHSYRAAAAPMQAVADVRPRGWAEQASDNFAENLMDDSRIAATEAGYQPDEAGGEYAIGE